MNLDQPWKIAALIGLLAFLRIVWGLWRQAPARSFMVELLDSGLIAFVLVFLLIRPFVVQAFYIPSGSMKPTLMGPFTSAHDPDDGLTRTGIFSRQGDRILVNKFIYRLNPPQRGDIIVFRAPPQAVLTGEKKDFVKRLIGLPGDTVKIKKGDGVYINGEHLQDPPGVPLPNYDWPDWAAGQYGISDEDGYQVPDDCYFVLGDNRNSSMDSHKWRHAATGEPQPAVESWRVLGKAMVVFWPPPRVGLAGDNHQVRMIDDSQPMLDGSASAAMAAQ
jgi:signal peptidase I